MNNEVQEDNATRAQIKKLYAVLYSNDLDPRQFLAEKGLASFNQLKKREISEIIDNLEVDYENKRQEGIYYGNRQQQKKKIKIKGKQDQIEAKGKILEKCLNVAIEVVANTPAINGPPEECCSRMIIVRLAKILFDSYENKLE